MKKRLLGRLHTLVHWARDRRWRVTVAVAVLTTIVSVPLLALTPRHWTTVGPLTGLWVAALAALCVLFGIGRALSVAVTALGAGLSLWAVYGYLLDYSVTVGGTVTCANHARVAGIYVRGADGESGWASWAPTDHAYRAHYSYALKRETHYLIGVGCGGTGKHWTATVVSPYVSTAGEHHFVCTARVAKQEPQPGCVPVT